MDEAFHVAVPIRVLGRHDVTTSFWNRLVDPPRTAATGAVLEAIELHGVMARGYGIYPDARVHVGGGLLAVLPSGRSWAVGLRRVLVPYDAIVVTVTGMPDARAEVFLRGMVADRRALHPAVEAEYAALLWNGVASGEADGDADLLHVRRIDRAEDSGRITPDEAAFLRRPFRELGLG